MHVSTWLYSFLAIGKGEFVDDDGPILFCGIYKRLRQVTEAVELLY